MKPKPLCDIDRSAGISCAATKDQGCPVFNQDNTHHERFIPRPFLRLPTSGCQQL
jgi:hypothetical protein